MRQHAGSGLLRGDRLCGQRWHGRGHLGHKRVGQAEQLGRPNAAHQGADDGGDEGFEGGLRVGVGCGVVVVGGVGHADARSWGLYCE